MGALDLELSRAFTYVFRDQFWFGKLGEIGLLSVLCPTPVIGLVPLCALLGYLVEIVHNVVNDDPRPLPVWDHIGEDVHKGIHVLVAIFVYHLPLVIALLLLYAAPGVNLVYGNTLIAILSALLPLLLLYIVVAWPMFAIALLSYAETWESSEFYQLGTIWRTMQNNAVLTMQWLMTTLVANLILALLTPVFLLGVVLFFPVHGFLLGSYGRRLRAAKLPVRRAAQ